MTQETFPIVELVKTIVSNLVDAPDAINIKTEVGDRTTIISIYVAKEDTGKVIGRQGKIIAAIRAICQSVASKDKKRVDVHIVE